MDDSSPLVDREHERPVPWWRRHGEIWIGLALTLIILAIILLPRFFNADRAPSNASITRTNLHNLYLAIDAYRAKHGQLPADIVDANGQPLLSWRVRLLPYLGLRQEFDEFHLDEPWDSPHNRALISRMPGGEYFGSPRSALDGRGFETNYMGIAGEGGALSTAIVPPDLDARQNLRAVLVEVDDETAVVWTRPADWQYDPNDPVAGLLLVNDHFTVMTSDASVRSFSADLPKEQLQALFDRQQKPLNLDALD